MILIGNVLIKRVSTGVDLAWPGKMLSEYFTLDTPQARQHAYADELRQISDKTGAARPARSGIRYWPAAVSAGTGAGLA